MRSFDRIIRLLGSPPIHEVSPSAFEALCGWSIMDDWGGSDVVNGVRLVAFHPEAKGKVRINLQWHEVAEHLWPWRAVHQHWWILLFGVRMAGGGGVEKTEWLRGHDISELPPRAECLKRAQRAARKMKG